ncbi:glycosyltransferase family 4 protein [Candidatus Methylospira mobilis]|uniref:glycosyltransferase family 4 protein n=1 Tax=Candidatus Methylospira mobilis TaxID=1808979 RepID=UPI001D17721E|nr:glycosyltransferase family 4 protein [Candidatus Methylospira mobilis]WNV04676.1 glycosyltransferase family 4 protein [Candidatus Methylospira mobilis]
MAESTQLQRLKIAVLNRQFTSRAGGAEHYSVRMVELLAQRHDIHVYAQQIEHVCPGVSYHRVPLLLARPRWLNQLWFAVYTWWRTRANAFDIVHSHENTWHGQVQTVHVQPIKQGLFFNRKGWRLAKRRLQVATSPRLWTYLLLEKARFSPRPGRVAIAVSLSTLSDLLREYPLLQDHAIALSPGVDLPALAPTPDERASQRNFARLGLGLPQQGYQILFIGNDANKKGLPTLMRALATLPDAVHLTAITHRTHIPALQAQAQALTISSRVHFLEQLADITPAYRSADMLAHPTHEDSFGMVVLEAMAHALPVVVSAPRWCGIAAELQAGKQALFLENPDDAPALAALVTQILTDAALAERLARAGRSFAENHNWSAKALQQEAIYYRIYRKPGKSHRIVFPIQYQ